MMQQMITPRNDKINRIFRTICFVCVALSVFSSSIYAVVEKKVRIAIVVDKSSGLYESPLVSLLEVKLSEVENVELLERQEISSILKEHKLSLAGLVQRDNIIKAGKLLRADALILLSLEGPRQGGKGSSGLLRIRIVETDHGIRLIDTIEEAGIKKVTKTADRIAGKVDLAAKKLSLPSGHSIALGIVDVQRIALGDKHKRVAGVLPAMLSSRLIKEPGIILLEREDLKLLLDEKRMTGGVKNDFLSSAVLINASLWPKGKNEVLLKLSLKGAKANDIGEFSVSFDPDKPVKAIDEIAMRITQQFLNSKPTGSWDPKKEAAEFYLHGQNLMKHNKFKEALSPLETAHALQPGNVYYTNELIENEWSARIYNKSGLYSDLELAEIVSLFVRQLRAGYEDGSLSAIRIRVDWTRSFWVDSTYEYNGYFARPPSYSTDQVREINVQNRKIWAETISKACEKSQYDDPRAYRGLAIFQSDSFEEAIQAIKDVDSKFILPKSMGGQFELHSRFYNCQQLYLWRSQKNLNLNFIKGQKAIFDKLWVQYLKDLGEIDDPTLQFTSSVALSKYFYSSKPRDKDQAKVYCKKATEVLPSLLDQIDGEKNSRTEINKRDAFRCLQGLYRNVARNQQGDLYEILVDILEPMIENKEVQKLNTWRSACFPTWYHEYNNLEWCMDYYRLLERIAEVFRSAGDRWYGSNTMGYLRRAQERITKNNPDLKFAQTQIEWPITMLLNEKDTSLRKDYCSCKAIIDGEMLWVCFLERATEPHGSIFLVGIDLVKKEVEARWQIKNVFYDEKGRRFHPRATESCFAIGKKKSYIILNRAGLIELPGTLTKGRGCIDKPKIHQQKNGLPAIYFTSMAFEKEKLWIGYVDGQGVEERGLGLYDPENEIWEPMFTSLLKDDPVFYPKDGSRRNYYIHELTLQDANELFFYTYVNSDYRTLFKYDKYSTLWKVNTSTRKLEKVGMDQRKVFEKDKLSLSDYWPVEKDNTSAFYRNIYWGRKNKTQLTITNQEGFEKSETIDNNIKGIGRVTKFLATEYGLVVIGENTIGLIEAVDENKDFFQRVNK